VQELIFYPSDQSSNRTAIEGNLCWHYGLQNKLPYNHAEVRPQTLPTDTDVLAFAAASGAVSIPDLLKIEDLVAYLKAQSLWDYARFYPMKSAQNAGSGSTVYGLGGLTSNNMTLVNSPTWGSEGVTFDAASSQAGTISDFLSDATLSFWWRGTSTSDNWLVSQYDSGASQRSIGVLLGASVCSLLRSSTGITSTFLETYTGSKPSAGDTVSAEWVDGGGRSFYINKVEQELSLSSGAPQTSRLDTSTPVAVMSAYSSGVPSTFTSGTVALAGVIETALTTTQRETITDLINAL